MPLLADRSLSEPRNGGRSVHPPQTEAEVKAIGRILRGSADGNDNWVQSSAAALGLESALRPRRGPTVAHDG